MSRERTRLILGGASIALIACATSVILIGRAPTNPPVHASEPSAQPRKASRHRNLSLRPEALSVSRQLGNRFKSLSRSVSTATGTLTIDGAQNHLIIQRRQTDTG